MVRGPLLRCEIYRRDDTHQAVTLAARSGDPVPASTHAEAAHAGDVGFGDRDRRVDEMRSPGLPSDARLVAWVAETEDEERVRVEALAWGSIA